MDRIYRDYKDKNVATYVIYTNFSPMNSNFKSYAYADADCTIKLSADELRDAFMKGAIIANSIEGDEYFRPDYFIDGRKAGGSGVTIGLYIIFDPASADTTFTKINIYSKEKSI